MPSLPMVGDELAGYRLRAVIGRGGMSVVYQAESPRLGSTVALKVLAPELATNDVFRARFLQESRVAAALNHPNVIPIYDMGSHEDLLYIAMRYVSGADLRAVLKASNRISAAQSLLLIGQAARALDAAHRRGLVHRDVKPANILIEHGADDDDPDHVYLADFGITKHVTSRSGLTATGEFVGTIDYIAPEQIRDRTVDGRADVYSLGCVLYECLTGRVPFVKDLDAAVIWAHVEEMPTVPSAIRPELPPGIDDVLVRALAKEPDDRYQTCRELSAAASTAFAGVSAGPKTVLAYPRDSGAASTSLPSQAQSPVAGAPGSSGPSPAAPPDAAQPSGAPHPATVLRGSLPVGGLPPASPPAANGPAADGQSPVGMLPPGAQPPGDLPPGTPPGGNRAESRRRRGRARWLVAIGVLALIAAAGIGVWLVSQGGGGNSQAAMNMTPKKTNNPLLNALAKTNEIGTGKGMLPPASCHAGSKSDVTCSQPAPAISTARFRTYPSLTALYSAYKATVKSLGQNPFKQNFGDCTTRLTSGEVAWNHDYQHPRKYTVSQMTSPGFPDNDAAGRLFCTFTNSQLYMVWTQNDGRMLGTMNGSPHDDAWLWWHGVHHSISLPGSQQMNM
jgi:serine/threonine protein kinase